MRPRTSKERWGVFVSKGLGVRLGSRNVWGLEAADGDLEGLSTDSRKVGNGSYDSKLHEKRERWGQGAMLWQRGEDGSTSAKNCWAERYETSEYGRGRLGVLGDQGNERIRAPNPELCQFSSYSAFLQKKRDISRTAEADASKTVSFESSRRVDSEPRKARG
ncbi:hypothetical protein BKA83DRAFT_4127661 [Pisolithus microcarpus]|nr:hypothetical protein BKA83DRAFT_4127661 [Pisolithus microcarpus]